MRVVIIALAAVTAACASNDHVGDFFTDWDRQGACHGLRTEPWGVSLGGTALGPCLFPGRFVWIVYDALWCTPCARQRVLVREADRAGGGDVVFVGVLGGGGTPGGAASETQVQSWAREMGFDPRQLVSEGAIPRTLPQHALIGPDGQTWFRHIGLLRADEIAATLDEFRSGQRQPGFVDR